MKNIAVLLIFLSILDFCVAEDPMQTLNNSISKITVQGNSRIKPEAITSIMSLKVKSEYSSGKAYYDFKKIFDLGYFSDLEIDRDIGIDGIEITIKVKERPLISNITYSGCKEVSLSDLETETGLKKGDVYIQSLVKTGLTKIINKYKEKGFYLVTATYEIKENQKDNKVDIIYYIKEGKKMYISKISFTGLVNFTEKALIEKMDTNEAGFLGGGTLNDDTLKKDLEKIKMYYYSEGFINAQVELGSITFDDIKEKIFINIKVTAGEQFKFKDLKISVPDETVYKEAEIALVFPFKEGDIFNYDAYMHSLDKVRSMYSDKGYIETTVDDLVTQDKENKTVSVNIAIKTGKIFYIGDIKVENNFKTRDDVILREMKIKRGDPFDSAKVKRSIQIYNLGFFDDIVPGFLPTNNPDVRDLCFLTVKERQTGQLQVGAGYSSLEGLTGQLSVSENNFMGGGQHVSAKWEFGAQVQNYELDFENLKNLFGNPISFGASVYNTIKGYYIDYKDQRIGGNIKFGFPISDDTKLWITYKFEQVNIFDVLDTASDIILDAAGTNDISSLTFQWVQDTRDSIFFNTKSGYRISASLEYAGGILLGNTDFTKYILDGSTFHQLFGDFVLALHMNLGYTTGFGDTVDVPFYEKFFCGGTNSVRGYGERMLSPLDVNGAPIGGDFLTFGNAEIRFPIYGPVMGVTFFDFGRAWDVVSNFDITNVPTSVGLGIRVQIGGAMVIRLDYGYGFGPQATPGGQVHFDMGNIF